MLLVFLIQIQCLIFTDTEFDEEHEKVPTTREKRNKTTQTGNTSITTKDEAYRGLHLRYNLNIAVLVS